MSSSFIVPRVVLCAECHEPGLCIARNAKIPSGEQHNECRRQRAERQNRASKKAVAARRRA